MLDIRIGDTTITATTEHPFWVVGAGWTAAGELRRGSALLTKDGVLVHVDTVERREGKFKVYNLDVSTTHTYFVGPLAVLVHNECGPYLKRFGKGPETLDSLTEQAANAADKGFPHGLSTRLADRLPDQIG